VVFLNLSLIVTLGVKQELFFWSIGTAWAVALFLVLVFTRYHYTVDVLLALEVTLLVTTHEPLIAFGRKILYPVDISPRKSSLDRIDRRSSMDNRRSSIDSTNSTGSTTEHTTMLPQTNGVKKDSVPSH